MSRSHPCRAKRCTVQVSPSFLMCARHWALVPLDLQRRVYQEWRKVCQKNALTREYALVVREAIDAVEAAELEHAR